MKKKAALYLITGFLLIICTLFACEGNLSKNKGNDMPPSSEVPVKKTKTETTTISAAYKRATVYAASTDYYFEKEDGEILEIRVSNIPEEQLVKLPEGMLEENVEEGPPDANPEKVDKIFNIIYNNKGEVIEIAWVE